MSVHSHPPEPRGGRVGAVKPAVARVSGDVSSRPLSPAELQRLGGAGSTE